MNNDIENQNKLIIVYPESSKWNKPILSQVSLLEKRELFSKKEVGDNRKESLRFLLNEFISKYDYKQIFVHCNTHRECFALICLLSCFLPELKEDVQYHGKSMFILINCSIRNISYFNIFRFSKLNCNEYEQVKSNSVEYKDLILFLRNAKSDFKNVTYSKQLINNLITLCETEGKRLEDNHTFSVNNNIAFYVNSKDDADKLEQFLKKVYSNETRLRLFNDLREYNYSENGPVRLGIGIDSFGYLSAMCNFFLKRNGMQSVNNFKEFKKTVLYKELKMQKNK